MLSFAARSVRSCLLGLLLWGCSLPLGPAVLVAAVSASLPATVEARSNSSGGYARPAYRIPRAPSTSGGYARPRTPSAAEPGFAARTPSPSDQAFSRRGGAEALNSYRAEQQARRTPGYDRGAGGEIPRGPGYGGWIPPAYTYREPSQFGPWNAVFLWFLLDTLNRPGHAQFFHDQQDDPGYRQWRAEADRQAEDNPQLRDKLNRLDQDLAARADQPRDPSYRPPDASAAPSGRPKGGRVSWLLVAILGGVLVLLWWQRRPHRATVKPGQGGSMSKLRTLGNFFDRATSSAPYRPSLFRVGMTISLDPTPFILAAKTMKVTPPPADAGHLVSVAAVGTVRAAATTLYRLYLPEGGFFQLHLDAQGHPDECRYFSVIDEVTPANPDEWGFWLDSAEGAIGWPEFQTKDGKVYGRAWSPGQGRIAPNRLDETIATASGTTSAISQAMLYTAASGAPPPAPPAEYILVATIEQEGQAWVRIAAGMDVNPASLSLA